MSSPQFKCPYCRSRFICGGCRTKHVRKVHPDKVKDYIKNYIEKGL